jgi:hypothetical protein
VVLGLLLLSAARKVAEVLSTALLRGLAVKVDESVFDRSFRVSEQCVHLLRTMFVFCARPSGTVSGSIWCQQHC